MEAMEIFEEKQKCIVAMLEKSLGFQTPFHRRYVCHPILQWFIRILGNHVNNEDWGFLKQNYCVTVEADPKLLPWAAAPRLVGDMLAMRWLKKGFLIEATDHTFQKGVN